ncbi:MAG: Threonylcarbamoyl-AMP synthase [uncultured Rubrobacteraceae bacterium]|uniref:L-threonylcarbamoyladenylate synthase n=1 Tax=uncultured Rubrobacteraceae bacterium TaxID=349277 RepID=A0A6J4QJJ4_9ACTN|nr:MAG: Threonylcarbamoyl-AMP synthase [uncultured Rubrobacteraceae bacterium]
MRYVSTAEAGELLRKGGVGLVPTETVVGLVAGQTGLSRLFEIKGRDPGKPIALLCGSVDEALALARRAPPLARSLAGRFWPGPLTLVLDGPHDETVGLRVPDHPTVQEVLAAHGTPIYATSANLSGELAPAAPEHVDLRVTDATDFAVPGAPGSGEASAVVDLSLGRVRLLRPGAGLTEDVLLRLTQK